MGYGVTWIGGYANQGAEQQGGPSKKMSDASATQPARLLVVDDDCQFLDTVTQVLEASSYHVTTARNAKEARDAAQEDIDLYLLDLLMPGTGGKVLLQEITERSQAGVIVVTHVDDDAERVALLEMGADDYIVKPFNERELVARVRACLRRVQSGKQHPVRRFGPWTLGDADRRLVHDDGQVVTLTPSEARVMHLFAANPDMVFSREEILAVSRLRQHAGRTDRSVDNFIRRLRQKIEPDPSVPVFIETCWGRGYALRTPNARNGSD